MKKNINIHKILSNEEILMGMYLDMKVENETLKNYITDCLWKGVNNTVKPSLIEQLKRK